MDANAIDQFFGTGKTGKRNGGIADANKRVKRGNNGKKRKKSKTRKNGNNK